MLTLAGVGAPVAAQTDTPPVAQPRLPNVVLVLVEGLAIPEERPMSIPAPCS